MRHVSALERRRRRMKYGRYQDEHFTGLIRSAFHVHSGCFESIGRLCIEGECLRWCGAVMAMIYRAPWKSHECPTRALSIPEVEPYLCDENKIVPTQISSLYAFLTLAPTLGCSFSSMLSAFLCSLWNTRMYITIDSCGESFVCLNKSWVLSQTLTKNLQSHRHDENL